MSPPSGQNSPLRPAAEAPVAAPTPIAAADVRKQRRQILFITIAAVAVYATLRLLPTGTNLNHLDFRVQGSNSIEMCDPLNPQFISVVAARSPVTLGVSTDAAAVEGRPVRGVLTLKTSTGKAITPDDLLEVHTRKLHLMIVDPTLTDYQHVHPEPASGPGEWTFNFVPRLAGTYRLFADFTPAATRRGLYASTDLDVATTGAAGPVADAAAQPEHPRGGIVERDGYRFSLVHAQAEVRARQPIDFAFRVVAADGRPVPLEPVMGAFAHLVAFDTARTGFAHLHPAQQDLLKPPDAVTPQLDFKLTIPKPGRYMVWGQVNLAGREVFVPFAMTVEP